MTRPILTPLRAGARGYFAKAKNDEQEILSSLRQIIFVNPGERFMRNDLGVPLFSFVFDPIDEIFQTAIEQYARSQIERHETRVTVDEIAATREDTDDGSARVTLTVAYHITLSDPRTVRISETFRRSPGA